MTYEEYLAKSMEAGKKNIDAEHEETKKRNAALMEQIGAAIDKSTAAQENTYQQSIDKAPSQYQSLYDANTIDEMIGRRQLKESMANLGLSDSGLSRTQDTALTVQRQNADAAVRADQTEYVQRLKEAIDTVRANAAAQKAEQQIAMDSERNSWYRSAIAQLQSDAQSAAAKAYEADQSLAAEKYKADQEAAAAVEKAKYTYLTQQAKSSGSTATDYDKNRLVYAQSLMKQDYSEPDAWAAAVARYPYEGEGQQRSNSYYKAYNDAKSSGYTVEYAKVYAEAVADGEDGKDAVDAYMCQKAMSAVKPKEVKLGFIDGIFNKGSFKTVKQYADEIAAGYTDLSDEERQIASAYLTGKYFEKLPGGGNVKKDILQNYSGLAQKVALTTSGIERKGSSTTRTSSSGTQHGGAGGKF